MSELLGKFNANYDILGKDFFTWYRARMAANGELIKRECGVAGDLGALMPVLLRHENALWRDITHYQTTADAFFGPLFALIGRAATTGLKPERLRDRTVRDALHMFERVIPDAEYEYIDNLDVNRNKYKHVLDDQLDGLLHLQRVAREHPEDNRNGELQREFEALFDAKQKELVKTMAHYWNNIKSIYFHYVANVESSFNYLVSVVD